ncbi:unnamed protein product [Cladocopium goreaui]|uniref:Small nuclear ribonucleoprotein Sm D3 (Sm-D3) (SnRNP core protein D3) n=4 Tax=Symbiodiniaceae TaxID=252141 RepID=A0A9P1M331_9DINO|nr:unnamed protein product [Cladocopium goreaui]
MSTSLVHILPPIEADQDENEADARAALVKLSKCIKVLGSAWQEALQELHNAQRNMLELNSITINSAIRSCALAGEWQQALWMLSQMTNGNLELGTQTDQVPIFLWIRKPFGCSSLISQPACGEHRASQMAGLGIPVKLLHEGIGHTVTCELKTGEMYRGHLMNCEDNMNAMLEGVTVTGRDGKVTNLEQVYLRGSQIRYFILPDMLRHAPMFKKKGRGAGRGVYGPGGKGRGKGLAQRARTAAAATRK